jgi:hypothetical protein
MSLRQIGSRRLPTGPKARHDVPLRPNTREIEISLEPPDRRGD